MELYENNLKKLYPKLKHVNKTNDDSKNILSQIIGKDDRTFHLKIEKNTTNSTLFYKDKHHLNLGNWVIISNLLEKCNMDVKQILNYSKSELNFLKENSIYKHEIFFHKICPSFKNDIYLDNHSANQLTISSSANCSFNFGPRIKFDYNGKVSNFEFTRNGKCLNEKFSSEQIFHFEEYIQNKIIPLVFDKLCKKMGFNESAKDYQVITELPTNEFLFHFENPIIYSIHSNGNNNVININSNQPNNDITKVKDYILEKKPILKQIFMKCAKERYVFDEKTGIWNILNSEESAAFFQDFIKSNFTNSELDLNYIGNNIFGLTKQLELSLLKKNVSFDSNVNLLGIRNTNGEIFNLETVSFEESKPENYILNCCDWVYDENEAYTHYNDVKVYIETLFPISEVRQMAMKWIACSLNGKKNDKTMLILTDDTGGDNGKTTFLGLISLTFDIYNIEGLKYLTGQRTATKYSNVDSQSSGIKELMNKRILYVDEANSTIRFDSSVINNFVSDFCKFNGRSFGSKERFSFNSTASILIACNENKFPQFDAKNVNFTKRMLVVKMLAKLTDDNRISDFFSRLVSWRSAFFKLLMSEYYSKQGFQQKNDVPEIVKTYTNELVNQRLASSIDINVDVERKISKFISEKLIYTSDKFESCTINDLKQPLKEFGLGEFLKNVKWVSDLSSVLKNSGFTILDRVEWSRDGKIDRRRNKILNMKLK